MIQPVRVTLGETDYEIKPLPIRQSREWREKLNGPFAVLVNVLSNAESIELTDSKQLGRLVSTMSSTVLGSVDMMLDLLYDYSPELKANRETIEAQAYDDEVMAAFLEVLKLAYPFGKLVSGFREIATQAER